jgi:hypothetical protein
MARQGWCCRVGSDAGPNSGIRRGVMIVAGGLRARMRLRRAFVARDIQRVNRPKGRLN